MNLPENESCPCPLCQSPKVSFFSITHPDRYLHCAHCDFRFLNPKYRLNAEEERQRYLQHNNDVSDPRYQAFVRPLFDAIQSRFPSGKAGLDFCAGTGPVLAQMLAAAGYTMALYDPFFWPDEAVLSKQFDFICATEVLEHLFSPGSEIERLKKCLLPQGALAIMTLIYQPGVDFDSWYYRRDPTHVGFFSIKTIEWIVKAYSFEGYELVGQRTIIFQ